MGPVIDDHDVTVWQGDARTILGELPAGSVQCIVTSPPYYGLRDYGTGTWDGGDPTCDHRKKNSEVDARTSTLGPKRDGLGPTNSAHQNGKTFHDVCGKCGAARVDQQIGLEPSPAEYVEQLRAVFGEARRVLAPDGVMWLNLGDSYASSSTATGTAAPSKTLGIRADGTDSLGDAGRVRAQARQRVATARKLMPEVGRKNLLGVPWRVAFALQDDGWILRNDIIWAKPNAMPESVTDRLSTRHEHVFLLTKSRRYWFNLDAIREPLAYPDDLRVLPRAGRGEPSGQQPQRRRMGVADPAGRNPGDVWSIPTTPTPFAHFATMPPELVRRCIQAGCPESGTVLDPFAGSGTTLMVARQLGRRAVGVELNPTYVDIIRRRIGQEPLNFDQAAVI